MRRADFAELAMATLVYQVHALHPVRLLVLVTGRYTVGWELEEQTPPPESPAPDIVQLRTRLPIVTATIGDYFDGTHHCVRPARPTTTAYVRHDRPPLRTSRTTDHHCVTTETELPFAGHPTLGSAYAWLTAGGRPATARRIVQEGGTGLTPAPHLTIWAHDQKQRDAAWLHQLSIALVWISDRRRQDRPLAVARWPSSCAVPQPDCASRTIASRRREPLCAVAHDRRLAAHRTTDPHTSKYLSVSG
jgi:hypothetical protein